MSKTVRCHAAERKSTANRYCTEVWRHRWTVTEMNPAVVTMTISRGWGLAAPNKFQPEPSILARVHHRRHHRKPPPKERTRPSSLSCKWCQLRLSRLWVGTSGWRKPVDTGNGERMDANIEGTDVNRELPQNENLARTVRNHFKSNLGPPIGLELMRRTVPLFRVVSLKPRKEKQSLVSRWCTSRLENR